MRKNLRFISFLLLVVFIAQIVAPTLAFALTTGPSQPEVQSFQPAGTSDMVDLFTGDFSYNITLMDVEGYPINISYNSGGLTADQEASWVGYGWNLNPGVVNRSVRGLPDDFSGDQIVKQFSVKENITVGLTLGMSWQLFGIKKKGASGDGSGGSGGAGGAGGANGAGGEAKKDTIHGFDPTKAGLNLSGSLGVTFNNYRGVGLSFGLSPSLNCGIGAKGPATASLGISANSADGAMFSAQGSYSYRNISKDKKYCTDFGFGGGASYSSRQGLKSISLNAFAKKRNWNDATQKAGASKGFRLNGNTSVNIGSESALPHIEVPFLNTSTALSLTWGSQLFGTHPNISISGFVSSQELANNTTIASSYGYLYAHESKNNPTALHDHNREKDGAFIDETPAIHLTSFAYDIFSVSGQGISGTYKPSRGDIGILYDKAVSSGSSSSDISLELGAGNAVHAGADLGLNFASTTTKRWNSNNEFSEVGSFLGSMSDANPIYEPAYIKQEGEKMQLSPAVDAFYNGIGWDKPVRISITKDGKAEGHLEDDRTSFFPNRPSSSAPSYKNGRDRRNQSIMFMPASQASKVGLDKKIRSYSQEGSLNNFIEFDRVDANKKSHHISEMMVYRSDGARYVFGIPAYNLFQLEKTFNVANNSASLSDGLVSYSGNDNTIRNEKGVDRFYSSTLLPAYAHSFLLTAVLSSDYVDLTGDGPSNDDLGNYTRFNYSMMSSDYRWRTPVEQDRASLNLGKRSDGGASTKPEFKDDKGSYVYGKKEIWHVHSIESKNMVAFFYISPRQDAWGVVDEDGGVSNTDLNNASYKLDSIVLYNKLDLAQNGDDAVPIRSAHLRYDYTLCPGVKNNPTGTGKLTLREVYFTYGRSMKSKFNSYRFDYQGPNYEYAMQNTDRWGGYKPNTNVNIPNSDYPYVSQRSRSQQDQYAAAWHLTHIKLPSGGVIHVNYESDDYASVQDRDAMEMFHLIGIGANKNYDSNFIDDIHVNARNKYFLFFELHEPMTNEDEFKKKYINGIGRDLYFKAFVRLTDNAGTYEYVNGYTQIVSSGLATNTSGLLLNKVGYVELKRAKIKDSGNGGDDINPICKASWNYGMLNEPDIMFPGSSPKTNKKATILALTSPFVDMINMFTSPYKRFDNKDYGRVINVRKSIIRLKNPNKKKFGGGSRVARIGLSDEWDKMTEDGSKFSYGQSYDYTISDPSNLSNRISSGVASYEPLIGNEENPFRRPDAFSEEKFLAPDGDHYLEEPYGEIFYPSPSVGYSRVTVIPLQHNKVGRTGTGFTVSEFYTAKDFPTKSSKTSLKSLRKKNNPVLRLLGLKSKDQRTVSQGFAVVLNDMHGKPKSELKYRQTALANPSEQPYASTRYYYKINPADNSLLSEADVLGPDGMVQRKAKVGLDIDFVTDMRETRSHVLGAHIEFNGESFILGIVPVVAPIPIPNLSSETTIFKSASATKVIRQYGILDSVVTQQEGSVVVTRNLLWDGETGEVLLTSIQNEFNDPIYSFSYPSHMAYSGMSGSYKNLNATIRFSSAIGNRLNRLAICPSFRTIFYPGDELLLISNQQLPFDKYWVTTVTNDYITVIDKDGHIPQFNIQNISATIVRSGRRNMQGISVGSLQSLLPPLVATTAIQHRLAPSVQHRMLSAEAVEFAENWPIECCGTPIDKCIGLCDSLNPYVLGMRGNWRVQKSYQYLTKRDQNAPQGIRESGFFKEFVPFWISNATTGGIVKSQVLKGGNDPGWTFANEVTIYNQYGAELENRDVLNRYSSALYGYSHNLPVGVATNAAYREIGYEGYEDVRYPRMQGECKPREHLNISEFRSRFFGNTIKVDTSYAHSGKYSLRVPAGSQHFTARKVDVCGNSSSVYSDIREVYTPQECGTCLSLFAPYLQKKYVASVWVYAPESGRDPAGLDAKLELEMVDDSDVPFVVYTSPVPLINVEGWRQLNVVFEVPESAKGMYIRLKADPTKVCYFDDLRLHPYEASFKSFVYDPVSLRLMAELDDRNFATFYEYDNEGLLVRMKRETERGIMTIQESRSSQRKEQ